MEIITANQQQQQQQIRRRLIIVIIMQKMSHHRIQIRQQRVEDQAVERQWDTLWIRRNRRRWIRCWTMPLDLIISQLLVKGNLHRVADLIPQVLYDTYNSLLLNQFNRGMFKHCYWTFPIPYFQNYHLTLIEFFTEKCHSQWPLKQENNYLL